MAQALKPGSGPLDYGNRTWLKILFAAIFFALYAPIFTLIAFSFNTDKRGVIWRGFTLDNYVKAWNNADLQEAMLNSLTIALISTIISTIIGSMLLAFEGDGRFRDARAGHLVARSRGEAGFLQFVDAGREGDGADIHRREDAVGDDIDGKDAGDADVAGGVLEGEVLMAVLDAQGQDGGFGREAIEEAEGRRIDPALAVDGCDQRDRARHHGADQELVFLSFRKGAEIEAGIPAHGDRCHHRADLRLRRRHHR